MRDTVMLDWLVPADEWERFRAHVDNEFGCVEGYLGREAERAMLEYTDHDGYADVEDRVDRLVEAAGRRHDAAELEKNSSLADQPTTRVTARVDESVKDEFREVARDSDDTFGVAFARAIRSRREGGRAARLERKLDRVIDDAEALLAETNDDSDGGMTAEERKITKIRRELDDKFTDAELIAAIDDVVGRNKTASQPTRENWRDIMVDDMDVEPHPGIDRNPSTGMERLWVPSENAADLVPDAVPEECRKPADRLDDDDDRVRRVQLDAGRRAGENPTGHATIDRDTVREEILEGEVTKKEAKVLMQKASKTGGISFDSSRRTSALKVNLEHVAKADKELFDEMIEYRDAEWHVLSEEAVDTSIEDFSQSEGADVAAEAEQQLDMMEEARAATDGGQPMEETESD